MDPRLQKRVQRYGWDRAAEHYESFWAAQLRPAQELLLTMAALRPDERVIDVAAGTGLVTVPTAEAVGGSGYVLATDLSKEMVERLRGMAADRGWTHVEAERMDGEALDVDEGSFDVALCALGMMYYPDFDQGARELFRVLRPGGRAVSAVWGQRNACGWAEIFPIVDSRVESDVCPMFFQLGTGSVLEEVMGRAGFRDVTTERISTVLEYDTPDDALGAAFAGGPVAMAYSRFDDETKDAAHGEYLESIERFRADGGYRIPGEFVVVRGQRP